MFVLNHPNGLVDPIFILCLAPRRVSFLAKSPLFRMPLIGWLVRAMEAIPVYRKQDSGEDTSKNRETFERSRALLQSGGTLAIYPEGVSHSEASLRPLKSGAARIALGAAAAANAGHGLDLKIVPAGLYYTAKKSFRSAALLYFGEPIEVAPLALDENNEPPREAVLELNARLEQGLRETTLNAEHHEALSTIARAERIFSAEDESADDGGEQSLMRELKLRRRFVEAYAYLRVHAPERIAALETRIRQYEEELQQAGFDDPRDLSTAHLSSHAGTGRTVVRFIIFLLLAPVALAGTLIHYPAYWLAGFLATKFSHNYDDVVSTFKMSAAMLLFPLTWIVAAIMLWTLAGGWAALASLVVVPLTGWVALRFSEEFDRFVGGARALAFFVTERRFFNQLFKERKAIRKEILALGEEASRGGALKTGA